MGTPGTNELNVFFGEGQRLPLHRAEIFVTPAGFHHAVSGVTINLL